VQETSESSTRTDFPGTISLQGKICNVIIVIGGKATKMNTDKESTSLFLMIALLRLVQKISFQTTKARIMYPKGSPKMISSFKKIGGY
jgi:hypothetical protein